MIAMRSFGLCGITSALLLVMLSFFVLVIADKLKKGLLRSFGNVIAMSLWVAAAFTLVFSVCSAYQGHGKMYKGWGSKSSCAMMKR
ncbi:MAG: hypothetical protein ISS26_02125 [Candidatus Omnitrophica bacterium]|nr:hypothetical protein [Candidatus Omnitrophota bacterium]